MAKCTKGKSCGETCITRSSTCRRTLSAKVSKELSRVPKEVPGAARAEPKPYMAVFAVEMMGDVAENQGRKDEFDKEVEDLKKELKGDIKYPAHVRMLQTRLREKGLLPPSIPATQPGQLSTVEKVWADDAKKFDEELKARKREGDENYNDWEGSYKAGMSRIGEGSYGSVIRNPDGTFIKRGTISSEEARLLKKLSDNDLGPKMIAADINGKDTSKQSDSVDLRIGRIAMSQVQGEPFVSVSNMFKGFPPSHQIEGRNAADIYWEAMARLHRLGIAHNDAHPMNLFVDGKGKGRWVDLGLAQDSPKAALAEVMGSFRNIRPRPTVSQSQLLEGSDGKGNWQTLNWGVTGADLARKVYGGMESSPKEFREQYPVLSKVFEKWRYGTLHGKLKKMGLTKEEIFEMCNHGIRSTPESFSKGGWAKLSDEQAKEVINFIYEGI